MNIFREIPPSAGLPYRLGDLLPSLTGKAAPGSLDEDFRGYLGAPYAKVTSSGTAALYLIAESLKEISSRRTIVIPSFICPSVPLAILRAGMKARVCDVNGPDFNFDHERLKAICDEDDDIAAIVAVHLGGIPIDIEAIERIARPRDICIIEDCAHALGATCDGERVGRRGDFSFFSMARGKGLTIYEGGVLAVNRRERVSTVAGKIRSLVREDALMEALRILELFGYWIFYRPRSFWFVFRLPQLFWNLNNAKLRAELEYYSIDFPIHEVSNFRKAIARGVFKRLDQAIENQREKASFYIDRLKGVAGVKAIKEARGDRATYPFLVLLFDDIARRNRLLNDLRRSGLGASCLYTMPIVDYEFVSKKGLPYQDCPGGRYLAGRNITLSTSAFLRREEMESLVSLIASLK